MRAAHLRSAAPGLRMGAGYKRQRGVVGQHAGHNIRGGARCRQAVQALVHQRVHRLRTHTIKPPAACGQNQQAPSKQKDGHLHHTFMLT